MYLERQLLFLFTAVGSLNGFFAAVYFAFFQKKRGQATLLLAALALMISIRALTSTMIYIDEGVTLILCPIAVVACFLIGPFLLLYIKSVHWASEIIRQDWLVHFAPLLIILSCELLFFGVTRLEWLKNAMFVHWLFYIILSGIELRNTINSALTGSKKISDTDLWLLRLVVGAAIVWVAHLITRYTNYIVAGWSFSIVFYALVWSRLHRQGNSSGLVPEPNRYNSKKINPREAELIGSRLRSLFVEKGMHTNPDLKIADVAIALAVSPHYLSQFLNDNLGQRFSTFVNAYRVEDAEKMVRTNHLLTLEAIGNECGFKSNSVFYEAFKKAKGMTPAQYKKTLR